MLVRRFESIETCQDTEDRILIPKINVLFKLYLDINGRRGPACREETLITVIIVRNKIKARARIGIELGLDIVK